MFELSAPYQPAGDQPQAIAKLTEGVLSGAPKQTLVGVTGSGKTFTIANVIQNVQRALNRGENYHQLHRAVSYANFGKLRFRTEYEQHQWGECSRLLTNCIIAYNATILSHLLAHKERSGDASGVARLIRVSPVAWQHINLYGRYEFRKAPATIDLPALIQELAIP